MIHIEKLSLKNVEKYTWQSFVDHLLGTKSTRVHVWEEQKTPRARTFINTDILSPYVLPKLKDVAVGKYYGMDGVDIDSILASEPNIENLVIEISIDNINSLPKQKLKRLLESYPVILNDFEECGTLYGPPNPHLVEILSLLNAKPKMLFLVGSGFQLHDYPKLNIYKIPFEYWAVSTAVVDSMFSEIIFDASKKQKFIDILENELPSKFCSMPLFKPRANRIELLSVLDQHGVLQHLDWSLAYDVLKHKWASTVKYKTKEPYTDAQRQFLAKYDFPKFMDGPSDCMHDLISPQIGWFNKYNFSVCAETYMGHEIPTPMGGCGTITEKTYKCFFTGASPIIYGPLGSVPHLERYGFKVFTGDFDNTDPMKICSILQDLHRNPVYYTDYKLHNFQLLSNLDFLIGLICEPLHKIADLINSIRR